MGCRNARGRGEALVELVLSLLILSMVLSSALQFLADEFRVLSRLRGLDTCRWGAQWWFSRLPSPLISSSLSSMPDTTPDGAVSFDWGVRTLPSGAVEIVLSVRAAGDKSSSAFTGVF